MKAISHPRFAHFLRRFNHFVIGTLAALALTACDVRFQPRVQAPQSSLAHGVHDVLSISPSSSPSKGKS
jgi:hypothetical protein